jgi:hypothetical protein
MLDKFSYGGHEGSRGDPFGHLSSPPSQFGGGHAPISMAAMAAMAAAGMGGKPGSNGHPSHEESLAFEMLRKTKAFFPQQQVAGRPAFPGQVLEMMIQTFDWQHLFNVLTMIMPRCVRKFYKNIF